jgi:hypothetical protein
MAQRHWMNGIRRFAVASGLTFRRRIFKSQAVLTLKMVRLGCPETSVTNYQFTPRNVPEERRSQIPLPFPLIYQRMFHSDSVLLRHYAVPTAK